MGPGRRTFNASRIQARTGGNPEKTSRRSKLLLYAHPSSSLWFQRRLFRGAFPGCNLWGFGPPTGFFRCSLVYLSSQVMECGEPKTRLLGRQGSHEIVETMVGACANSKLCALSRATFGGDVCFLICCCGPTTTKYNLPYSEYCNSAPQSAVGSCSGLDLRDVSPINSLDSCMQ